MDKKTGRKSVERKYFETSLTDAAKAAYTIRSDWSVENNLHLMLDTVFKKVLPCTQRQYSDKSEYYTKNCAKHAQATLIFPMW